MYSPAHYQYSDEKLIREVIEQNPFATMISGDLSISHLPIYLQGENLIGHMAKANSHWQIAKDQEVTVIFHGPHAYISPSWYRPSPANVPTWNYVTVHARGKFKVITDEHEAFASLEEQVIRNEGENGWRFPEDRTDIDRLFKAITVFEIGDLKLEGKFKLSQKHDEVNKKNVVRMLEGRSEEEQEVAELMKRLSFN